MKVAALGLLAAVLAGPLVLYGCGGSLAPAGAEGDDGGATHDATPTDGAPPPTGTIDAGPVPRDAPIAIDSPIVVFDTGSCLGDLQPCVSGAMCCSGVCFNGACETLDTGPPVCQPDGSACATFTQCCSSVCGNGVCGGLPFDSGPACQPDGTQCLTFSQCCSGICGNGICGGTGPMCQPDGTPCMSFSQCCSGVCGAGICGNVFDSGPPACVPPAPNQCTGCLAGPCCPQLGACENDPVCSAILSCFDSCYVPGSGIACSQKCTQQFPPSPIAQMLDQCAASACGPPCQ